MLDSSAKIPSGVLSGNVNQFGDFDQCLQVQEPAASGRNRHHHQKDIQGKYCLAYLQPTLPEDNRFATLKHLYDRVQSHGAFRSNFDDVSEVCWSTTLLSSLQF